MAIISCPECGKNVSDRAVSCPECGCPIAVTPATSAQQNEEELSKLFILAHRARECSDSKNAQRYYGQILDKIPGNWEAIFYTVYYEALECKIAEISSAANSVANCIYSTFAAIDDLDNELEKEQALTTIILSATHIATLLANGAKHHYDQYSTTSNAYSEYSTRVYAASNIYSEIESTLESIFPAQQKILADFRKLYVNFGEQYSSFVSITTINMLNDSIAEFYPEYGEAIQLKRKKEELENNIFKLNSQINSIVTERKSLSVGCGGFLLIVGLIMFTLGFALNSLDGGSWPIWVGLLELAVAIFFFKKSPSEEVIKTNLEKKQQLIKERDDLQNQLDSLS